MKELVIDNPRYQCFAAGCPANHASKRDICEDPLIAGLHAMGTSITVPDMEQMDALLIRAASEIERLRAALLLIYQRTEQATLHGAAVDAHAIAKEALKGERS